MSHVLDYEQSGRRATGRLVDLSHSSGADISYHKPSEGAGPLGISSRREQTRRQTRRSAANTQREKRKDILFSARNEAKHGHNRDKGDISGYGNFSRYAGTVIGQYGTLKGR